MASPQGRPSARSEARASASRSRTTRRSDGPGDEGEHHAQRPFFRRPQQGAELGQERGGIAPDEPRRALPERRVRAGRPARGEVVGAHVPGAHGDRPRPQPLEQAAIDLDLLLLRRPPPGAAEEVLGAEQADALRAVLHRGVRLAGELRVGQQVDPHPVPRDARHAADALQRLVLPARRAPGCPGTPPAWARTARGRARRASRPPPPAPPAAPRGTRSPAPPPRECPATGPGSRCDGWASPDRWRRRGHAAQSSSAASDGSRSSATTTKLPGSRDSDGASPAPLRFSRMRPWTSSRSVPRSRRYASLSPSNSPRSCSETVRRAHSAFTWSAPHHLRRPLHQQRVVEHQQVGVEDVAVGTSDLPRDALPDGDELLARPRHRALQARDLAFHRRRGHEHAEDGHGRAAR